MFLPLPRGALGESVVGDYFLVPRPLCLSRVVTVKSFSVLALNVIITIVKICLF